MTVVGAARSRTMFGPSCGCRPAVVLVQVRSAPPCLQVPAGSEAATCHAVVGPRRQLGVAAHRAVVAWAAELALEAAGHGDGAMDCLGPGGPGRAGRSRPRWRQAHDHRQDDRSARHDRPPIEWSARKLRKRFPPSEARRTTMGACSGRATSSRGRPTSTTTPWPRRSAPALPFVDGHLALMPDAHWGMGATIRVRHPDPWRHRPPRPSVSTSVRHDRRRAAVASEALGDDLSALRRMRALVPAGVGRGPQRRPGRLARTTRHARAPARQAGSQGRQPVRVARVGQPLHRVCLDERDVVWVVLHSGSRGVGNKIAHHHIDGAKALMKRMFVQLQDRDLAYLVEAPPSSALHPRTCVGAAVRPGQPRGDAGRRPRRGEAGTVDGRSSTSEPGQLPSQLHQQERAPGRRCG